MIRNFDHVTLVVTDLAAAKGFFALLGFEEDIAVVISGERMAAYMGIDGIEADHVTLALPDVSPRTEVQLLKYHHPDALADPNIAKLNRIGFNHICFAVDDLEGMVRRLTNRGVRLRNDIMEFHDRKLVFVTGPDGITVELAEWQRGPTGRLGDPR